MTTLFALHGFTLNGRTMRDQMGPLVTALGTAVELVFPDAPHSCSEASIERLYAALGGRRSAPPHLSWWDSSDDGRVYRGWQESAQQLQQQLDREVLAQRHVGVLGFSQGAMVAATLAALSSSGALPALRFVVVIAGRVPRADDLRPLFDAVVRVPSLHVWGSSDTVTGPFAPDLAERFDAASREVVTWDGAHKLPRTGPAANAIVDFVRRHA